MTNNRLRCLVIFLGIGLIICFIIGTIIYLVRRSHSRAIITTVNNTTTTIINNSDSCPRPNQYETEYDFDFTKKSHERQNINSSIDYFRLSLSWSPTFCQAKKQNTGKLFQCQHNFGFIVHGLWPSSFSNDTKTHPRNCRNEPAMPMEIIKKYFCLIPSEVLMQAEWEKHGTCYWSKPEDYLEQINSLYSKLHLPKDIHEILNNQTISKKLKRDSIKGSFLQLNPQLSPHQIDVKMTHRGKNLREVDFCYDRNFTHIQCY